jgi:hypothetical protein
MLPTAECYALRFVTVFITFYRVGNKVKAELCPSDTLTIHHLKLTTKLHESIHFERIVAPFIEFYAA